jgi:hypothetical protein
VRSFSPDSFQMRLSDNFMQIFVGFWSAYAPSRPGNTPSTPFVPSYQQIENP